MYLYYTRMSTREGCLFAQAHVAPVPRGGLDAVLMRPVPCRIAGRGGGLYNLYVSRSWTGRRNPSESGNVRGDGLNSYNEPVHVHIN